MKRRHFIHHLGLAGAGLGLLPHLSIAKDMASNDFGVALFTLPKSISEDFGSDRCGFGQNATRCILVYCR